MNSEAGASFLPFPAGLYRFLIAVYLKSIFAYLMESESKLLAPFFAVLFSTASYPGPDASSLVAASADALCVGTYLSSY